MEVAGFMATLRRALGGRGPVAGESFVVVDGVRGFAVLLVVLGHLDRGGVSMFPRLPLFAAGVSGVELFFVLSAFLLSSPLLAAPARDLAAPRTWATYAARRLLRIYPLYFVVLVVGTSVPSWSQALFGPREVSIIDHLLCRQGAKIMWAVPVEMKFYCVLPFLAAAVAWVLRRNVAAALVLVAGMLVVAQALVPPRQSGPPPILLAPQLPYFVAGMAAATLHRVWRPASAGARVALEVAGLSAFAWWVAANLLGQASLWPQLATRPVWRGLTLATFLFAAVEGRALLAAFFRLAPLRFLGVLSFSMYLLHMPVTEELRRGLPWDAAAKTIAVLVAATALSTVSYLVIEYPFIELGRRLSRRRAAAKGAA